MKKFSMNEYATKSNALLAAKLDALVDPVYSIFVKNYFLHDHGERLSQEILQTVARNKLNFKLSVRTFNSWGEFSTEEKETIASIQSAIRKLDYVTNEAYQLSKLFKKVVGVNCHYNSGRSRDTGDFCIDYGVFLLAMAKERLLPSLDCQLTALRNQIYIKDYPIVFTNSIDLSWDKRAMEKVHLSWKHFVPFVDFDDVPYLDIDDYICCLIKIVGIQFVCWAISIFPIIALDMTWNEAVIAFLLALTVPVGIMAACYFLYQYRQWSKEKNDWRN